MLVDQSVGCYVPMTGLGGNGPMKLCTAGLVAGLPAWPVTSRLLNVLTAINCTESLETHHQALRVMTVQMCSVDILITLEA